MPSLGADMEEGTLTEWQVQVGDELKAGDTIAVIETNKGAIDMEVFDSGVITELCLEPVVTVPVGTVMATMTLSAEAEAGPEPKPESEPEPEQDMNLDHKAEREIIGRVPSSPAARLMAQREHINLSSMKGSGPHGAVLLRDLYLAEPHRKSHSEVLGLTPDPTGSRENTVDVGKIRSAIARVMEKSKREIPHYYLTKDINISIAQEFLCTVNAEREPEHRLLLLAVLLRAIAKVLPEHPQMNGYYQHGIFEASHHAHIGNAITLRGGGVVVPAIHSVEQLSLDQTMEALRDVIGRSRSGHLRSSELTDATVTVSSIGDRGVDTVFGVIYPPQVAIIGVGKPQQKIILVDDEITTGLMITVTLSADHRVSDGFSGANFLNALDTQLQHPEKL